MINRNLLLKQIYCFRNVNFSYRFINESNKAIISRTLCSSQTLKKDRTGYVVGYLLKNDVKLSDLVKQSFPAINIDDLVQNVNYPRKHGDILLQPGFITNEDKVIGDLCVIGIGNTKSVSKKEESLYTHELVNDVRKSVEKAIASLRKLGCSNIYLDSSFDDTAIAESGICSSFSYKKHASNKLKSENDIDNDNVDTKINIHSLNKISNSLEWNYGLQLGEAQNLARKLKNMPSNLCTPTIFCELAADLLKECLNVTFEVKDKTWVVSQGMGGLIGVSKGSFEEPRFLIAKYQPNKDMPVDVCLVGKGVTFDSGGISIKPAGNMDAMRADMGGAAVTLSAFHACSKMQLPLNVTLLIPLCENMPDGAAVKPGDVIETRAGLTVKVDNTDAEGRLILADALDYAVTEVKPKLLIDVATLTGAIMVALGDQYAGLFCNQSALKTRCHSLLIESGMERGDYLHQMPMSRHHRTLMKDKTGLADLCNIGAGGRGAGSSTAAAFLSYFVAPDIPWMHIDMAGVMQSGGEAGGMTGRPARALVHFLVKLSKS